MSFSICLWKAHFVHTKWYWKIDTTTNTLNVFSIILFVSWGPCVLTPVSQGYAWSWAHLIQRVFYVVSYFMWFNCVDQGCSDLFTGNVQGHRHRKREGWEATVGPVAEVSCWHTSDWCHSWSCVLHSSPSVFTFPLPAVTLLQSLTPLSLSLSLSCQTLAEILHL